KKLSERRYLPTLPELIDRLSIVLLKAVFIPENHDAYMREADDIEHDIDLLMEPGIDGGINGKFVRAVMVTMLANRFIWENESKARAGGSEQDKLLKLTHSVNGVRNRAKNVIAEQTGERKDLKTDCLAAELLSDLGMRWDII